MSDHKLTSREKLIVSSILDTIQRLEPNASSTTVMTYISIALYVVAGGHARNPETWRDDILRDFPAIWKELCTMSDEEIESFYTGA